MNLNTLISGPWPWWFSGPAIGLFVPALLLAGNRLFGVSSNLRTLCAALIPADIAHFKYDWKSTGSWNLLFALGVVIGAFIAGAPSHIDISPRTLEALTTLGLHDFSGSAPAEVFTWHALLTPRGFISIVVGGSLVGFGTAWAGGCTSGHAISGLADRQLPSLIAVCGFFAGGLIATFLILPMVYAL